MLLTSSSMRTSSGALVALVLLGCSGHERATYTVVSPPRDWSAHPAIVEMDAPPTIYAMSDVHGGYERMVDLLVAHHVIAERPPAPAAVRWNAGGAVFVMTGDVMDKGASPLEAFDVLRALEPQAAAAGGRVIFTLGNHEAEFLYDPENDKATKPDGVDHEIRAWGLTPVGVANGSDVHGK